MTKKYFAIALVVGQMFIVSSCTSSTVRTFKPGAPADGSGVISLDGAPAAPTSKTEAPKAPEATPPAPKPEVAAPAPVVDKVSSDNSVMVSAPPAPATQVSWLTSDVSQLSGYKVFGRTFDDQNRETIGSGSYMMKVAVATNLPGKPIVVVFLNTGPGADGRNFFRRRYYKDTNGKWLLDPSGNRIEVPLQIMMWDKGVYADREYTLLPAQWQKDAKTGEEYPMFIFPSEGAIIGDDPSVGVEREVLERGGATCFNLLWGSVEEGEEGPWLLVTPTTINKQNHNQVVDLSDMAKVRPLVYRDVTLEGVKHCFVFKPRDVIKVGVKTGPAPKPAEPKPATP